MRPIILMQPDFNTLTELVAIFTSEVMEDQIRPRAGRAAAVEPAVVKLVRDAQERLSYRVARFIEVRYWGGSVHRHHVRATLGLAMGRRHVRLSLGCRSC